MLPVVGKYLVTVESKEPAVSRDRDKPSATALTSQCIQNAANIASSTETSSMPDTSARSGAEYSPGLASSLGELLTHIDVEFALGLNADVLSSPHKSVDTRMDSTNTHTCLPNQPRDCFLELFYGVLETCPGLAHDAEKSRFGQDLMGTRG